MTEMEYALKLSDLIKCETVSAKGNESNRKFDRFHDVLRNEFPLLFKNSEYEEYDGSILLKWKGKSEKDPVMFMNHQDVVPAEGEWTYPPFNGEIHDKKIYGRGTLDTKGGLFSMMMAAEELISEGFNPATDIYFESSCTEETDGRGGKKIAETLKERGIKFKFILDEGGMIMYDPIGGCDKTFAVVGVGEKCYSDLKFTARSNGGHSSTPEKNSPVVRLSKFVSEVEKSHIFTVELIPAVAEMFKRMGKYMKGISKLILTHPKFFKPLIKMVIPGISPTTNALFKTTCAFTMMKGSDASNVMPEEAYVIANLRFSHHQGKDKSIAAIKKIAEKYGLDVEVLDPGFESPVSDYNNEGFKRIEDAVKETFNGVEVSPYIANGASDSRFFTMVSDNVYRFVPFIISEEQLESIHGLNENLDIENLPKAVHFYKILMKGV